MTRPSTVFLIAVVPAVLFLAWLATSDGVFPYTPEFGGARTIYINDVPIAIEIADTAAQRQQGLSGRTRLPENHGLLFVFDELGTHGIWMKDMQFAIDIIWIAPTSDASSSGGGEQLRIVDIKRGAAPDSYPEIFYPRQNALYVLEINAGFTDVYNIAVGDSVQLAR